ncbi:DEAD/DEAH box helicase [Flavobacterium johnsoniae]|uniref:DEAD/DEAH box helicase n=1 Tax=Flavobacterium johnsoniae TaxID=986 RepID=UPI0011EBE243|nr:ATP-binding domain-containing protein [Flavobacterium johnsoniae]
MDKKFSENNITKDSAANSLMNIFDDLQDAVELGDATLYYKYPFYTNETRDKEIRADFLAVTQNKDVHIFSCVNHLNKAMGDALIVTLENLYNIIDSKLRNKSILKKHRDGLKFRIHTHIFTEDSEVEKLSDDIIVFTSYEEVSQYFSELENHDLSNDEFKLVTSVIEGIDESIVVNERAITKQTSRGAVLGNIEASIINFDVEQFKAVVTKVEGFQRIRGLAGTGKTIILARKVAELHRDNPKAKILYTYYTKALNEIVKKHITRFYKKFSQGTEPDWNQIDVIHSWGGKNLEGVYYKMCKVNGVESIDLKSAKTKSIKFPFEYVCGDLLKNKPLKKYYDYVLIDEGQDFKENFYRLCNEVVHGNNVIWAYDEFQDILKSDIQSEKELFGKNDANEFIADFSVLDNVSDHDIVLKKCYRNSKLILTGAFAFGLGVYNEVDEDNYGIRVLQRLESKKAWEDIGFNVLAGTCKEAELMSVERPIENSPDFKEQFLDENLINISIKNSIEEECIEVANNIKQDLIEDLRPEDICVICLDNANINDYFKSLTNLLSVKGIKVFDLQDTISTNIRFTRKDCVTLTSVYKAKGNEAGSIYILGVDAIFKNSNDLYERNKLFTAITRSKGWVFITGSGDGAKKCKNELDVLVANGNELNFYQPSGKDVRTIKEMSTAVSKKKKALQFNLAQLAKDEGITVEEYVKKYILKE